VLVDDVSERAFQTERGGQWLKPQIWLSEGDVMTLGIDGLGAQRQTVIGARLAPER
jgi:2-keto-4-pentenoate hydratase/2-oxohepta-3-ene-1,7-dioic acid hydratase in catechol pathway